MMFGSKLKFQLLKFPQFWLRVFFFYFIFNLRDGLVVCVGCALLHVHTLSLGVDTHIYWRCVATLFTQTEVQTWTRQTHTIANRRAACAHTHTPVTFFFSYHRRLSQDSDDIVLVIRKRFQRRVIREWLCSTKPVWPVLHFDINRPPTVWPPLWKHTCTHFLCELYLGNKVAYKLTRVWEISNFVAWIFPFL